MFPFPLPEDSLAPIYFISTVIILALIGIAIFSKKYTRVIIAGLLFYGINLSLVLQIQRVGNAILAERYTYVSYIGLFIIIGWGISHLWKSPAAMATNLRIPVAVLAGAYSIWICFLTFERSKVWKDGESLWTSAIASLPVKNKAKAYDSRGIYYRKKKTKEYYLKAVEDFTNGIALSPDMYSLYSNRGSTYFNLGMDAEAEVDFLETIELKPESHEILCNLGSLYGRQLKNDLAFDYFNQSLEQKPSYADAFLHRGTLLSITGKYQESIDDYNKYIELNPVPPIAGVYNGIGVNFFNIGNSQLALAYFRQAVNLAPNDHKFKRNLDLCTQKNSGN